MSNLCAFGDSVMKGVVYDEEKHKYSVLHDSFANTISDFFAFSTENFAKFGCTVTKGLEIAKKHLGEIKASDYVALEFGGNDSDFNWKDISENPSAAHEPKTSLHDFENNYTELVNVVRSAGGKPVMLSLPPLDAHKYFMWVSRGLNKQNILKWLGGSEEYIYKWHETYNIEICKLAQKLNVPMIDIRTVFLQRNNYRDYFCSDGIHPNERGHILISEAIERFAEEQGVCPQAH